MVAGSGNESLLVRAVGPTLAEFGLTGLLADPQLAVYGSGEQLVASNDNWGGGATLATAFQQAGAFPLPTGSLDSAVLMSLPTGAYTAVIDGANNGTGVALLEAYDVDTAPAPVARCVNVSALGLAGAGSNSLTIGFVITGATSKTLLIRSIGPTLASFGIGGSMANPQLTIYVAPFPLPPTTQDAAQLVTLAPAVYSAVVAGANGSTGIALIELYEMP